MLTITESELKAHLRSYLNRVKRGESFVVEVAAGGEVLLQPVPRGTTTSQGKEASDSAPADEMRA